MFLERLMAANAAHSGGGHGGHGGHSHAPSIAMGKGKAWGTIFVAVVALIVMVAAQGSDSVPQWAKDAGFKLSVIGVAVALFGKPREPWCKFAAAAHRHCCLPHVAGTLGEKKAAELD